MSLLPPFGPNQKSGGVRYFAHIPLHLKVGPFAPTAKPEAFSGVATCE